jgi:hypothetical protein
MLRIDKKGERRLLQNETVNQEAFLLSVYLLQWSLIVLFCETASKLELVLRKMV